MVQLLYEYDKALNYIGIMPIEVSSRATPCCVHMYHRTNVSLHRICASAGHCFRFPLCFAVFLQAYTVPKVTALAAPAVDADLFTAAVGCQVDNNILGPTGLCVMYAAAEHVILICRTAL